MAKKWFIVLALTTVLCCTSGAGENSLGEKWRRNGVLAPLPLLPEVPKLVSCGINDTYRCMNDSDYMKIIIYQQQMKFIIADLNKTPCFNEMRK